MLDTAAQPLRSRTRAAALTVVLDRDGGDLARTRRLGPVSRTTARAALQNLAELGLVRAVPGSGVQVQHVAEAVAEPEMQRTLDRISVKLDEIKARLARLAAAAGDGEPVA